MPASNSLVREAKKLQMRGISATPAGTLIDIDTLLLFRKRPKGTGNGYAIVCGPNR
ncbi:hypothetical protein JJB99_01075 [Bradyrhizobium diazoefficiens]|uniref:hypothetical protein n=1 Tax=Bradyrhizobium diazoefficiens TaxID=1355477 RepID=UPI00190BE95A|nr:hypothetical protein [Bradyrhizobium diazoefficiens]QQO14817.1 hypothetical protein JJB99_01075 [Bradyrhizobium diazoefficiens]